jgi:hypothetical protein
MDFDFDFDFDFDGDGGLGLLPVLIVGKLIGDALERRVPAAAPGQAAPPPQPRLAPAPAGQTCAACRRPFAADFAFCPHCGHGVGQRECRYCGRQQLGAGRQCVGCGAPLARS